MQRRHRLKQRLEEQNAARTKLLPELSEECASFITEENAKELISVESLLQVTKVFVFTFVFAADRLTRYMIWCRRGMPYVWVMDQDILHDYLCDPNDDELTDPNSYSQDLVKASVQPRWNIPR